MDVGAAVDPSAVRHAVRFYALDDDLVEAVCGYLRKGIQDRRAAVVIATPGHVHAFDRALSHAGIDVTALRAAGTLVTLDARDTLGRFMRDGRVDPEAFDEVIGGLIRGVADRGLRPIAYGEMVAVLWEAGEVVSAIELEERWNALLAAEDFSLLCAYPTPIVGPDTAAFAQVCALHSDTVNEPGRARWGWDGRSDVHAVRAFARVVDAASEARHFAADTVEAWGHSELVQDVSLTASELASNAILHSGTDFVVSVGASDGVLRVAVEDGSPTRPAWRSTPPTDSTSGRGLVLVAAVAERCGVDPTPGGGKVVWAEFAVDARDEGSRR